ncbi:hypothetical protein ACFWY9_23035 [Amycolatopsis sp. NPDC059027]|uniref:hypothetical protein n=1 Tax=Amycolatopsis sp. NPDC059027 TaxID=3346709 RepID=UPI00366F03B9
MVAEGPLTAAEIYDQITNGPGTGKLSEAQGIIDYLGKKLNDRSNRVILLREKTLSGWQGGAAQAAADSTEPLAMASADDSVHLSNADQAVGDQMTAFSSARNSVKKVPAQQPEFTAEDLVSALNGNSGGYRDKVSQWQADSQHNIDTFSAYHSSSGDNNARIPTQYSELRDPGAPVSMAPPGGTGDTGGQDGKQVRGFGTDTRTGTGTDTGTTGRSTQQPGTNTGNTGQTTGGDQRGQTGQQPNRPGGWQQPPGHTSSIPDGTRANSYVPKPIVPPAASNNYQFGPTGQPVNPYTSTGGGGEFGPYGSGNVPGGGGPGGSGSGGYRSGSGTGGGANEPGRGAGRGSGAGMPGERVPGGGRAGMPGGPAGAAGAKGANGMPMGAGAGGKGKKKEEDKEHKAPSYLLNPDPDETFGGTEVKPMPPVIGEQRK